MAQAAAAGAGAGAHASGGPGNVYHTSSGRPGGAPDPRPLHADGTDSSTSWCKDFMSMQQLVPGFYSGTKENNCATQRLYDQLLHASDPERASGLLQEQAPYRRCGRKRPFRLPEGMSAEDFSVLSQLQAHWNAPANIDYNEPAAEPEPRPSQKRKSRIEVAEELDLAKDPKAQEGQIHWIESARFNTTMGGVIAFNSLIMAIEVDYELDMKKAQKQDSEGLTYLDYTGIPPEFFIVLEIIFTVIFTTEICLRAKLYKCKFFKDGWAVCDVLSVLPSLILLLLGNTGSLARQLQLIRMLRLFKLCRLLRLIKLFKELHLIVSGFVDSLKTLGWVVLLLLVVVFTFAVFNTMTVGLSKDMQNLSCGANDFNCQSFDQYRYFGSTVRTMLTLFQIFTLDSWAGVCRPVVEQGMPMMLPFFIMFIFLTTYGLLNLLIGVIVEHTSELAKSNEDDPDAWLTDKHGQTLVGLIKLFMQADSEKAGKVQVFKLKEAFEKPKDDKVRDQLLEIYQEADIADLLSLCSIRAGTSPISFQDYLGAALRLQGAPQAKDSTAAFFWVLRQQAETDKLVLTVGDMKEQARRTQESVEQLLQKKLSAAPPLAIPQREAPS